MAEQREAQEEGPEPGSSEWWNQRYASGEIPWDTGIVPPEVEDLVRAGDLARGWALDLGCGTGLNSRYLAAHGFRVVGVDLATTALAGGQRAARERGLPAYFCAGDVARLDFLSVTAALAIDIGCLHAVRPEDRETYVSGLARHLAPGAYYLLYAFYPGIPGEDPAGVGPLDIARFAPHFVLRWTQHGHDYTRPSAWYLLQRKVTPTYSIPKYSTQ